MTSGSGLGRKRPRTESQTSTSGSLADWGSENARDKRPRLESRTSLPSVTTVDFRASLTFSAGQHRNFQCSRRDTRRGARERGRPHTAGPTTGWVSVSAMHTDENEDMVVTTIQATDVALGLRRLPAGFYIAVHHSILEWRTENKSSSVNDDVIEWSGPIPT
ncbi:hypothetical protein V8E55_008256 [Tylopilus felleus]